MSAPTPGPGWTEVAEGYVLPAEGGVELLHWAGGPQGPFRRWILTPPPALPTALGSVVRIDGILWTLESMGWRKAGDDAIVAASDLQPPAFDVVAVPPAVTAAAVLAAVRAASIGTVDLQTIAKTYGVTLPSP